MPMKVIVIKVKCLLSDFDLEKIKQKLLIQLESDPSTLILDDRYDYEVVDADDLKVESTNDIEPIPIPKRYLCDPDKNNTCPKTACQWLCFHTLDKQYRAGPLKSIIQQVKYIVSQK